MKYRFDVDNWGGQFSVPCSVATRYLKISDGDHIKVLLCILASATRDITTEAIAQSTGLNEDTVDDAVIYWKDLGILHLIEGSSSLKSAASVKKEKQLPASSVESIKPADKAIDRRVVVSYTNKEILEKAEKDENLKKLFDEIQQYIPKSITHTEMGRLIELYELYRFDVPSILITAEYCKQIDKCSIAYISKVLESWHEQGICTYSEVEAEINRQAEFYAYENIVRRCFGISNRLSAKQKELVEKWKTMGIDESLLSIAKDKCLDGTGGKINFGYINKVIETWKTKGITTPEQVKQDDDNFRNKNSGHFVGSDKTNSYSVDQVEKMLKNIVSRNEGNK